MSRSGLPLTLLSVAALAAAGAVRRRGSFSTLPDASLAGPARMDPMRDRLRDGDAFDPQRPYTVTSMRDATVTFDPREGIGEVSDNANITYKGFVVWMPVSDWLALNPPIEPQSDRVKGLEARLREGAAFGPPFLVVEVLDKDGFPISPYDIEDDLGPAFGGLRVRSHEGRHRMQAIRRFAGDVSVPVQIFTRSNFRARDFTPAMLRGARIHPDPRVKFAPAFPIGAFVLDGVVYR